MKVEGVLDRIEDGKGTVLVESIGKEFIIEASQLPAGCKGGDWLFGEIVGDQLKVLSINHEKTKAMREKAEEKLNRIRNKSGGSKFRRG